MPHVSRLLLSLLTFTVLASPAAAQVDTLSAYFTASDGTRIHYYTQGTSGSWVVLIHGYTDSARRMWITTGVMPDLARDHRVVALDNRNHGRSDRPEPNGVGRAEDVVELMDHLGIDIAHIHGYSMGGGITGRLLASHSERFITASFGGSGFNETDPELRAHAASLDPSGPEPEGAEARAFENLRNRATARAEAAAADPQPSSTAAPPTSPQEIDLRSVLVPVLAINGEHDRPYSRTHRMWRELPDFRNVVLPGRNHMSAIGVGSPMPPEYREALREFITINDP